MERGRYISNDDAESGYLRGNYLLDNSCYKDCFELWLVYFFGLIDIFIVFHASEFLLKLTFVLAVLPCRRNIQRFDTVI